VEADFKLLFDFYIYFCQWLEWSVQLDC